MKKPLKESKNEKDQTNPDQQNPSRVKLKKSILPSGFRTQEFLSCRKTIVLGVTGSIGAVR